MKPQLARGEPTSWLFTSAAEELNWRLLTPPAAENKLEPDLSIRIPAHSPLDHSPFRYWCNLTRSYVTACAS